MRKFALLFYLISLLGTAQDKPGWIDPESRISRYSQIKYFVGYTSQYFSKNDDLNEVVARIESLARATLCESIQVTIISEARNVLENLNGASYESYSKSVITSSNIIATGLKVETFLDKKSRTAYALAYLEKSVLLKDYELKLQLGIKELEQRFEMQYSDLGQAYDSYLDIINDLENLRGVVDILTAIQKNESYYDRWQLMYKKVEKEINQLGLAKEINLVEACRLLASKLKQGLGDEVNRVVIGGITYKGTSVSSELSSRMKFLLIQYLTEKGLRVTERNEGFELQYILDGSYWPGKENIQVSASIRKEDRYEAVEIESSATVFLSLNKLRIEGISHDPKNLESALETNSLIVGGERPDLGMHVELWTNKSGDAQTYKEGEKLKVSIRVNQPAYVRILNVWNDGSVLLLMDNEFVTADESNKRIEIGGEFETQCPCGVEHLLVIAQEVRFSELETYEENGFLFVKNSLGEILNKTRSSNGEDRSYSEQTITVTTIPK